MDQGDDSSDDCEVIYESNSKSESSSEIEIIYESNSKSDSESSSEMEMMFPVSYVVTLPTYDDIENMFIFDDTPIRHSKPTRLVQIVKLNPWKRDWYIKARVLYKSNIRTWNKPRSEGRYFHLDLSDDSGSISVVGFTDVVDLLYHAIEVNKVYYISGCDIKRANKRYSRLPHNYQLHLTPNTLFELYDDTPQTTSSTIKIAELEPPVIKNWTLIELAREAKKQDYSSNIYHTEATVLAIRRDIDKVVYEACPLMNCSKKVVCRNDAVEYYCPKCDKKYTRYEYRFMLRVLLADWTGMLWTTFFQQAENFLGVGPSEMVAMYEKNDPTYESLLKKQINKSFTFLLRPQMELYEDEISPSGVCDGFFKINYPDSCRRLINELKKLKTDVIV